MFTCRDGKGGKLSSQASKMLYKPPGAVYIASYKEPLDQSDCWKLFVQLWNYTKTQWRHKTSARCWRMMARVTRIYILIIKVNKLFSFFSSLCFLKEIENMYSVFLSSYTNTRESLGELEKLWKHSPAARVPTAFLVLPNFHSCLYNSIETVHVFYFLNSPS